LVEQLSRKSRRGATKGTENACTGTIEMRLSEEMVLRISGKGLPALLEGGGQAKRRVQQLSVIDFTAIFWFSFVNSARA
jgi:hypothetical protein